MIGGWVSLTAILIDFQSRGGPHLVTLYLFFLTLMPAILARPALVRLKNYAIGNIWCFAEISQAILIVTMAVMVTYLPVLLVLVSATAVMQNIAASTQMSLISKKVSENKQDGVLTAISSGSSLSLVLGPAAGGLLVGWLGLQAVFLVNSACCICAVLVVPWRNTIAEVNQPSHMSGMMSYRPPAGFLSSKVARVLASVWIVFAIFGLLFDSIEMPFFIDIQRGLFKSPTSSIKAYSKVPSCRLSRPAVQLLGSARM